MHSDHRTATQLLQRLKDLLPAMFEEVLFKSGMRIAYLHGGNAPQVTRAIELIRHLENENQLPLLKQILDEIGARSTPVTVAPIWVASDEDGHGRWAAFQVKDVQQRMRWIPPGTFLMGSPELVTGRSDDEGPQHWVTITKGYWLGETPVTQALWAAVMTDNPSFFNRDPSEDLERPVERVSWDVCQTFLDGLNLQVAGLAARLPTEAEWERACRAEASNFDDIAWYVHNSKERTRPVGRKAPNVFGLHDMLGNVWEWCADGKRQYTREPVTDPVHTGEDGHRVYRGGSYRSTPGYARAAYRYANHRDFFDTNLGFRLAAG